MRQRSTNTRASSQNRGTGSKWSVDVGDSNDRTMRSNVTERKNAWGAIGDNTGSSKTDSGSFEQLSDRKTGSSSPGWNSEPGGGRQRTGRRKSFLSGVDPQKLLLIIGVALIVVILVVGLIVYGPGALNNITNIMDAFARKAVLVLAISAGIWLLTMIFLGRLLPGKLKLIAFIVILAIVILAQLSPGFGRSIGLVAFILLFVIYILYLIIHG